MASAKSSQDMWRGRDHQPPPLESPRPRHRSESRRVSDRKRPVRAAARKRDRCPGALHEGDAVRVFSRSVDKWVDGEVVKFVEDDSVWVEYEVCGYLCGKTLHLQSEHFVNLANDRGPQVCAPLPLCGARTSGISYENSAQWEIVASVETPIHGLSNAAEEEKRKKEQRHSQFPTFEESLHEYIWTRAGALGVRPLGVGGGCCQGVKSGDKFTSKQLELVELNYCSLQNLVCRGWLERDLLELGEDILDYYLRNPSVRHVPDGYIKEGDLLRHLATGVLIWGEAISPLSKLKHLGGDVVLYHYCPEFAFRAILAAGDLNASVRLNTDCDFGVGQYATKKQPHKFRTIRDILYNNYPRATSKYSPGEEGFPPEDRASHCIPLLINLDWAPALPLTDPDGPKGAVSETRDRYGTFDGGRHDIWIVDARFAEKDFAIGRMVHQPLVAFLKAAEQGQVDVVKLHLQDGVKASDAGQGGVTGLHLAAVNGHMDMVRELVSAMADVNAKIYDGQTDRSLPGPSPLMMAVAGGHCDIAHSLISAKADVNIKFANPLINKYVNHFHFSGETALACAVEYGAVDMVRLLLSERANITTLQFTTSRQPLALAIRSVARHGNTEILRELISCQVDVNEIVPDGCRPLHEEAIIAFDQGPLRQEVLKILRDAGYSS